MSKSLSQLFRDQSSLGLRTHVEASMTDSVLLKVQQISPWIEDLSQAMIAALQKGRRYVLL